MLIGSPVNETCEMFFALIDIALSLSKVAGENDDLVSPSEACCPR